MVRILVVDDHSLMRRAVREVIDKEEGLEVVAEASTAQEAEELAVQTQPDVVLMDADLPDGNGFDATRHVLDISPQSHVVIFTGIHQEQLVFRAIQKGAIGYITKNVEPDALVHAIRCAARNDLCIPVPLAAPIIDHIQNYCKMHEQSTNALRSSISYRIPRRAGQMITSDNNEQTSTQTLRPLTDRESQILDLMRKGHKNREISSELNIAESTVHKHVQNIFEKLHARNRAEAIYLTTMEA
jgi:two-component system, NarL family, nitrate/nitrite response regulator NarL